MLVLLDRILHCQTHDYLLKRMQVYSVIINLDEEKKKDSSKISE